MKVNEIEGLKEESKNKSEEIESLSSDLAMKVNEIETLNDIVHNKDVELCNYKDSIHGLETELSIRNSDISHFFTSFDDMALYVDSLVVDYNHKIELIHSLQLNMESMNSIYSCLKSVEESLQSASGNGDYLLEAYANVITELSEKLVECFSQLSYKSSIEIDAQ